MAQKPASRKSRWNFVWLALIPLAGAGYYFWPPADIRIPEPHRLTGVDPEISREVRLLIQSCRERNRYDDRFLLLAKTYQANGFYRLAAETYGLYLKAQPRFAEGWYLLGISAERSSQPELAADALRRCIELNAPYPPCYWRLALWRIEAGAANEALEILDRGRELTELDHYSQLVRAKAHLNLDEPDRALQVLEEFDFSRTPNAAYADFLRGSAWRQLGKTDLARRLLPAQPPMPSWQDPWSQNVERMALGVSARRMQASGLFYAGNYAAARRLLEGIIRQPQADSRDWSMLGAICIQEEQIDRAVEYYRRAIAHTPADPWLYYHLARAYWTGGRKAHPEMLALGLVEIARAIEMKAEVAEFFDLQGSLLQAASQPAKALVAFDEACRLSHSIQACHWNRLFLLLDSGQLTIAEQQLEDIARRAAPSPEYHLARATLSLARGDPRAAEKFLAEIPAETLRENERLRERFNAAHIQLRK